jgi:hypothetical protein
MDGICIATGFEAGGNGGTNAAGGHSQRQLGLEFFAW